MEQELKKEQDKRKNLESELQFLKALDKKLAKGVFIDLVFVFLYPGVFASTFTNRVVFLAQPLKASTITRERKPLRQKTKSQVPVPASAPSTPFSVAPKRNRYRLRASHHGTRW